MTDIDCANLVSMIAMEQHLADQAGAFDQAFGGEHRGELGSAVFCGLHRAFGSRFAKADASLWASIGHEGMGQATQHELMKTFDLTQDDADLAWDRVHGGVAG